MEKQNLINNNENIKLEDQQLIEQIDEYNINQLLMNIFKRLIIKAETQQTEKTEKEKNDNSNSSLLSMLIEKIKKNYPNFYFSLKEPNENFGLFYTDMGKLTSEYAHSDFTETDGFSLLGFFEEEIRNFFRTHPFLLKNSISNNNNNEYNEEKNKSIIEMKIKDITNLLKENNEIMNDIFKEFKNAHDKDKQKYIDYVNQQHSKIKGIVEDIKGYSFNTMNSEQSLKSFDKFKEILLLEQKQKEEEIKFYKALLNKYTSQGEEMTQLLNEYKRYSNMIDCLKDK
jgi:hypothetical protein